jgi:hypothetical protein
MLYLREFIRLQVAKVRDWREASVGNVPGSSCDRLGWPAGSLDITAAFVEADLKGKSPVYLLQVIAGGLLGMSSFREA